MHKRQCNNCRWWFPLGILVGGSGALGAVSALRHKNKPGADLVMPAGGVQLLGVLTGAGLQIAARAIE